MPCLVNKSPNSGKETKKDPLDPQFQPPPLRLPAAHQAPGVEVKVQIDFFLSLLRQGVGLLPGSNH